MTDAALLSGGREAFPAILAAIADAKRSIEVNMFIWRDDAIGNEIAAALLDAADRGVKISLSVDRYGSINEHAEEARRSFFHKRLTFSEWVKVRALEIFYPPVGAPKRTRDEESDLYRKILSHPGIVCDVTRVKADHSKFYIIDDEVLILGGINIEEKERGADMQGRVYGDYMVMLRGKEVVREFRDAREGISSPRFGLNRKSPRRIFDMEGRYLSMLRGAKREITIVMAYFSPLESFLTALLDAAARGVKVRILIPSSANYQDSSNKRTVALLREKSGGAIRVFFSPRMLHTKLVIADDLCSFGSCNITKKAFGQLDELNYFETSPSPFTDALRADINAAFAEAIEPEAIRYGKTMAFLESFLV